MSDKLGVQHDHAVVPDHANCEQTLTVRKTRKTRLRLLDSHEYEIEFEDNLTCADLLQHLSQQYAISRKHWRLMVASDQITGYSLRDRDIISNELDKHINSFLVLAPEVAAG